MNKGFFSKLLVVIGVNDRGEKRFLAIEDGARESTQSWWEVLLKLKAWGMNFPIVDGGMGFWAALEGVIVKSGVQQSESSGDLV